MSACAQIHLRGWGIPVCVPQPASPPLPPCWTDYPVFMRRRFAGPLLRGVLNMEPGQHANTTSPLPILLNATAGGSGKEDLRDRLADLFRVHGLEATIAFAHSGVELVELARQSVRHAGELVVAGGGDGTINAVASALLGTNKVLGVLPLGTLNHFAKDLQIPLALDSAVQTILAGRIMAVDVGDVNGHIFLNNSSLGIYPHLVHEREAHQQQGRSKWFALCLAALRVLYRYPRVSVHIRVDGQALVRMSPLLFVGNNEYSLEGRQLGARTCLDQGRLCVYVLHQTGRWGLLRLLCHLLLGQRQAATDFDALSTPALSVEARRPHQRLRVSIDGEVIMLRAPLHYRIRPAALHVIVPSMAGEAQP